MSNFAGPFYAYRYIIPTRITFISYYYIGKTYNNTIVDIDFA